MIERQLKTRILKLVEHFPAVAILGARQVGKTTLAKMLMSELSKENRYLDLENPADLARLENPLAFFQANQDRCLIIDEIQRKPELFPILRSVIDQHRVPGRLILLGSANPVLIKLSSETLAGRIVYTELTPFHFLEIKKLANITNHWLFGGFPEPFLMTDKNIREEWFNAFIMTYIERDLPLMGLTTSSPSLLRFVTMLSHTHGQILNQSTYAKSLELSVPTIAKYLGYLESAFLIRRLHPFYKQVKKRLVKSPKVYLRDSGLLHHLHKINDYHKLLGHPLIGHSWEGYIIEQIISMLSNRYEYFFYRSQDGAECDLVITEKFNPVACVEIKFAAAPKKTKSITIAVQDIQASKNFVIIPDCSEPYPLDQRIQVCSLEQFFELL